MLCAAPPLDVTDAPKLSAGLSAAARPAGSVTPALAVTVADTCEAASVSPTSRSVKFRLPVRNRSCAAALGASETACAPIAFNCVWSLVPTIVNLTSCVPELVVPSLTLTV